MPDRNAVLVVEQQGQKVGSHCSCPRKDRTSSPGMQDCSEIRYVLLFSYNNINNLYMYCFHEVINNYYWTGIPVPPVKRSSTSSGTVAIPNVPVMLMYAVHTYQPTNINLLAMIIDFS